MKNHIFEFTSKVPKKKLISINNSGRDYENIRLEAMKAHCIGFNRENGQKLAKKIMDSTEIKYSGLGSKLFTRIHVFSDQEVKDLIEYQRNDAATVAQAKAQKVIDDLSKKLKKLQRRKSLEE